MPASLFAGGGAFNTLVVVNTNSADSVELGNYYATAHGIPDLDICQLGIATNLTSVTSNEFRDLLLTPITSYIASNNLGNQIDFVVLSWDFPTRVRDVEGVTASLFYGFHNAPGTYDAPAGECKLSDYASNAYYRAERAFRSTDGWNSTNGFITFYLVASNLPAAQLVVDRGTAAQASFPAASIYLHALGEASRYEREQLYADTQFSFLSLPGIPASCVIAPYRVNMSGKTNVIGYQDGYGTIYSNVRTNNIWMPGAYADHFTSWGGMIANFTNATGQSTVLDWMGIGATASYGTVQEPCNYIEKFPDPRMAFLYARGFTIGEAYFMAVAAPYQGLFAGDPLAAPFAAPPALSVTSQVSYQIVTGTVPVQVSATARSNGVPAAALDLYLDGRFQTNLATLGPTPSNTLSIVVGGRTNSATITNSSLFGAVADLAGVVNADTNQIVSATAHSDRLELIYKQFNHAGDSVPVSASVSPGTATTLTLGVGLAATNLVPSIYPARKRVWLFTHTSAGANSNDTLTCIVTLTNGVAVTNIFVAAQGEQVTNLLERLRLAIVTNPTLLATNGVSYDPIANGVPNLRNDGTFFARTLGPDGAGIQIDYTVNAVSNTSGLVTNYNFSSFLQDWPDDLRPRASVLFHVRPTNGILAATASFVTTNLADGIHTLDFIARDGSAVAAQSRLTLPLTVCNASPQLSILGTNSAAITNGEPASLAKGTDFGPVQWGHARTNTFAIRNNGTAALSITGWITNGPNAAAFQISGIPATVQAGGVSNFTAVFAPTNGGSYQASLRFDSDAILDQTNILLAGNGAYALTVVSEHGTANPSVGIHTNPLNAVLTNSISVPAPAGGTQLVCTGWTMPGHAPTNGSGTNFEMTVTNNATLTWLWSTNYWLAPSAGLHGSINVTNSWQAAGITTQITATANPYYSFSNWTGSVSETNNPLNLLMDAPKSVQANFSAILAASNTPEWWLAEYGWTNNFNAAATNDAEPDGFFTWQEYIADTDPTNAASYPRMTFIETWQTNQPILTWPASTGRVYQIHHADDLVIGDWITQQLSLGIGEWTDTNPPPATNRYYRIAPQLP